MFTNRVLGTTVSAFFLVACSTFSSGPTATVNQWRKAYEQADFDNVISFCTNDFITNRGGVEKLKQDMKHSYDMEKADGGGKLVQFANMKEHANGDKADVCWQMSYRPPGGMKMMVHLVRQNGKWKIDDFGSEKEAEDCLK